MFLGLLGCIWSVFCDVFWVLYVSDLFLLCGPVISGIDVFLFESCILYEWVTLKSISLFLIKTSVSSLSFSLWVEFCFKVPSLIKGTRWDNCLGVSSYWSSSLSSLLSLIEAVSSISAGKISLELWLYVCYLFVSIGEICSVWSTLFATCSIFLGSVIDCTFCDRLMLFDNLCYTSQNDVSFPRSLLGVRFLISTLATGSRTPKHSPVCNFLFASFSFLPEDFANAVWKASSISLFKLLR